MNSNDDIPNDLLPPSKIAAEMHVTARTIRMWVAKGRLRAFRTDMGRGGRMLISRSEVRKMLTMVHNKPAN